MTRSAQLFPRYARTLVLEALADTRVVFVTGARQVGKSTLARDIVASDHPAASFSLDVEQTRQAAIGDPAGFLAGFHPPVLIDEVQRAPDLLLAIKDDVDRNPQPGRYLLTGSANVVTNRSVKDALTGRMEIVRLWPLAQSEIHQSSLNVVDVLFEGRAPRVEGAPVGREAFAAIAAAGGYPEARLRDGRRRQRWFASYLETTLDRDLRDLDQARKLDQMPRMLRYLASQAAGLLSFRNVAANLDLNHETVRDYVGLLETVFLVRLLPAWRPGIGSRERQAPKCHLVDSGLLAHLLGADERRIAEDDQVTGRILENFVTTEILKHADWAATDTTAYHYRQRDEEVDLVLESRAGEVVAIEVKAAATLRASDWRPLERLREARGERFRAGAVIHPGAQTSPLGDRLWAVPVSGLWARQT